MPRGDCLAQWLSDDDISTIVNKSQNNEYGIYLSRLLKNTNNM